MVPGRMEGDGVDRLEAEDRATSVSEPKPAKAGTTNGGLLLGRLAVHRGHLNHLPLRKFA